MNVDDAKGSILPPPFTEQERINLLNTAKSLRGAITNLHVAAAQLADASRGIERFGRSSGADSTVGGRIEERSWYKSGYAACREGPTSAEAWSLMPYRRWVGLWESRDA